MRRKSFRNKILEKLDKLDADSLRDHFSALDEECEKSYKILQSVPEGILIIEKNEKISFINEKARDILMRSASEEEGRLTDIVTDKELHSYIQKIIRTQRQVIHNKVNIVLPKQMQLLVSIVPIYDEYKEKTSFLVVLSDIKKQKKHDERSRNAALESLVTLAAGIAHEIGNPLNTIHIYMQLISEEIKTNNNQRLKKAVGVIGEEIKRLDGIIKNFLSMTRAKVALFKKGDINTCIENAVNFLMPELIAKKINVTVKLNEKIPVIYLDEDRIYEVIINLIRNAIDAMPNGGKLSLITSKKDNVITILCQDNGEGIKESDLPHVFDAYFTTKKTGSGLGLMNAFNVIKAHNGNVHIDSEFGKGTSVLIEIPVQREKLQLPNPEDKLEE